MWGSIFRRIYKQKKKMESDKRILMAFDFDHTLIEENSDLYVKKLAPNGELPEHIESLFKLTGWTEYMGAIFEYLHSSGIKEEDMKRCMEEIPITKGMEEMLKYCHDKNHEVIIISDSNSVFIDMILSNAKLHKTVTKIFTNPAYFDDNGCLKISYYHTQDWCDLSTVNLCKGNILQDYIEKRKQDGYLFDRTFYIGDGTNDFCPSLTLKERDFVCPRIDFRLWKKIQKLKNADQTDNKAHQIQAQIIDWTHGLDILEHLKRL